MSYRTREQLIADFLALESHYPNLMSHEVFGKSYQNRDMYLFKVGNPYGGRVMFDGSCHGNERLGSEICYFYAKWLLEKTEPAATRILERNLTLLVPIVNVDGFASHRKNMNFESPRIDGVDLNRNFDWNWDGVATTGGGVSDDPISNVYRGPYAESEPESRVYRQLWAKYKPKHYLNIHTFDTRQIWWADTKYANEPNKTEDKQYFLDVYNKYKQLAIQRGQPYYPVSNDGGTGNYGMSPYYYHRIYSWSAEVDTTTPPYSEIPIVLDNWLPFFITLSQESEAQQTTPIITVILLLMGLGVLAYFLQKK